MLLLPKAEAHEGMWLVHMLKQLNEGDMQALGLQLSADDIYSINNSSVKDAIVRLNGGSCTAEVISDQGLVLTNHHCAYGAIQTLSTNENNFLDNGFWAMSHEEELSIPDMYVSFLKSVEDVTDRVLAGVTDAMTEDERAEAIGAVIEEIQEEHKAENMEATVKSMYYGNEYYLMIYKNYTDIRLVGAPAESIGKFGGDTDNWMWPRHTGDFSMIRIYAGADNEPAEYSKDNKPYKPAHHLPVSLDGVESGDFTMIMGYPGSTDRFLTSFGVDNAINNYNPTVVALRDERLKTMKMHMDADPAVRLKYASSYAGVANYWKYFQGQTLGLKRLDVHGKKSELEAEFTKWVAADSKRKAKYGEALTLIENYYKDNSAAQTARIYLNEAAFASDIMIFSWRSQGLARAYNAEEKTFDQASIDAMKEQLADRYKDYDMATDKDVFVHMFGRYVESVGTGDDIPEVVKMINKKCKGNVAVYAEKLYATSVLSSQAKMEAFLSLPAKKMKKVMDKDLGFQLFTDVIGYYRATTGGPDAQVNANKKKRGYRLLTAGLREMQNDATFYPDANSTMRLSYGQIGDYFPADAVHYDFVTTSDGILQKKDNSNPEFVVKPELEKLLIDQDFGRYADANGNLVTGFISNNDITGGNSGSPVMNAHGHLIGLAFDGNWEAMSGDIAFEPELQRTISVDIRYVMFIVDKLAGAQNIIDEIDFVKTPVAVPTPEIEAVEGLEDAEGNN